MSDVEHKTEQELLADMPSNVISDDDDIPNQEPIPQIYEEE